MLVSSNVTMQFGSKPLFENISVKFGGGNRYGLIGANGSGKSTFMKILGGDLEPTLGNVSLDPNERIGKLRQDQFAFEAFTFAGFLISSWLNSRRPRMLRTACSSSPSCFHWLIHSKTVRSFSNSYSWSCA